MKMLDLKKKWNDLSSFVFFSLVWFVSTWRIFGSLCFDPAMENASSSFIILSFNQKKLTILPSAFHNLYWKCYIDWDGFVRENMNIRLSQNAKYWCVPKYVEAFQMHLFILWDCMEKCKDTLNSRVCLFSYLFFWVISNTFSFLNEVHYNMQF